MTPGWRFHSAEPTSTIGRVAEFVPPDFGVPLGLETSEFLLEPLGPEHNERDYDAWTSSVEHIAATPGYPDGSWPREMTRDENRADLQRHEIFGLLEFIGFEARRLLRADEFVLPAEVHDRC